MVQPLIDPGLQDPKPVVGTNGVIFGELLGWGARLAIGTPPTLSVWSNFEIADMDFWRSEAYSTFFDYLDNTGGFYYERWGDAPVHSIGAALLANKSQVHFFRDIGYRHPPFQRCPQGALHSKGKCWCDPGDSFGEYFFKLPSFVQTHVPT